MLIPTLGRLPGLQCADLPAAQPSMADDHRTRWWHTDEAGEAIRFLLRVLIDLLDSAIGGC